MIGAGGRPAVALRKSTAHAENGSANHGGYRDGPHVCRR